MEAVTSQATLALEIANNWDALGMRARASQDVDSATVHTDSDLVVRVGGDFNLGFLAAISSQSRPISRVPGMPRLPRRTHQDAQTRRKGMGGRPLASHGAIQRTVARTRLNWPRQRAALERPVKPTTAFSQSTRSAVPLERLHAR